MGEPDCCLSCKTAASATIGNRPLRIRTVGGVGGRREYPHASYPIEAFIRRPVLTLLRLIDVGFGRFDRNAGRVDRETDG